ncbi:MAG: hypothetical protein U0232_21845 [Thermomicrobiales bacterium]
MTTLGLVLGLITEHHWKGTQLIAWGLLALGALRPQGSCSALPRRGASSRATRRDARDRRRGGRHLAAHRRQPQRRAARLSLYPDLGRHVALAQWWTAAREGVGPSPPLAPGALALVGLCILLATVRHPALSDHTTARTSPG